MRKMSILVLKTYTCNSLGNIVVQIFCIMLMISFLYFVLSSTTKTKNHLICSAAVIRGWPLLKIFDEDAALI